MNIRSPILICVAACFCSILLASFAGCQNTSNKTKPQAVSKEEGLAAWDQVYSVLTHPRCINCHTATNFPDQGDDRHRHFANIVRGPDGHGVAALQCITCHQESNANSPGVPGGHDWHLAPLSMRWQDENGNVFSKTQLCKALASDLDSHEVTDRTTGAADLFQAIRGLYQRLAALFKIRESR